MIFAITVKLDCYHSFVFLGVSTGFLSKGLASGETQGELLELFPFFYQKRAKLLND